MDKTAILPNGQLYDFWEKEQIYEKELHVNRNHPAADDNNCGSADAPFKTIQAAAEQAVAEPECLYMAESIGSGFIRCLEERTRSIWYAMKRMVTGKLLLKLLKR